MANENATKHEIEMVDARIERVASQYSDAIASVRATMVFATVGNATGRVERQALAFGHRIAADFLDALSDTGPYTSPHVELGGSHRNRVSVTLSYELCAGTVAEADEVVALMHDVVPAPEA